MAYYKLEVSIWDHSESYNEKKKRKHYDASSKYFEYEENKKPSTSQLLFTARNQKKHAKQSFLWMQKLNHTTKKDPT